MIFFYIDITEGEECNDFDGANVSNGTNNNENCEEMCGDGLSENQRPNVSTVDVAPASNNHMSIDGMF